MFFIIELLVVLLLIWLIGNVLRYWFFKDQLGGGPFALSDRWIELEKQVEEKLNAKKK